MKKRILALLLAAILCAALAACSGSSTGGTSSNEPANQPSGGGGTSTPITIRLQGAFAEGTEHYYYFDQFCQSVSERSNGTVTVVWGSGPEAIPTDQLAEAMQNGIVEMV